MSQKSCGDAMGQKDRISVDVGDLKSDIESCRMDAAWVELPLSAKIRVLIKERLEQLRTTQENQK